MKKLFAAVAILAVSAVQAEELKFGDLNYFIKQGQFNLAADIIQDAEETRLGGNDFKVDGYYAHSKISYALANNLNVFFGLDYLLQIDTTDQGSANKQSVFTDGLQNPKLGVNYRLLNQDTSAFNLDFGAIATVKVMDREQSSTSPKKEGNIVNPLLTNYTEPRDSLEVNARAGKKWNEANEFYLIAGAIYHRDGDYEDLGTKKDVDVDSSVDYKLGAFYQYRPVNEFMMTLGALGTRYSEKDVKSSSVKGEIGDHIDVKFNFAAKFLVTENLIARFDFNTDKRDNYKFKQDGSAAVKVDKRLQRAYGIGVDWLF